MSVPVPGKRLTQACVKDLQKDLMKIFFPTTKGRPGKPGRRGGRGRLFSGEVCPVDPDLTLSDLLWKVGGEPSL
jgi:hypothetical protein